MYDFCTYFDIHYLPRALALYESLVRHCQPFRLWALCMDERSAHVLGGMSLPHLRVISLEEFERGDEDLVKSKQTRSRLEYYFTCTASLALYILNQHAEVDLVSYVDSDLFFFSSPRPLFDEMGDASIAVIEHRFQEAQKHLERYGIFNVGFLSFRRDEHGLACLQWWRERCIEWCYDREEDGKFADQKYLDAWPGLFSSVCTVKYKGAGVAPWNIGSYEIASDGQTVRVDGDPLVFYHFHGLNETGCRLYESGLRRYGVCLDGRMRSLLYRPYLEEVLRARRRVDARRLRRAHGGTALTRGSAVAGGVHRRRVPGVLRAAGRAVVIAGWNARLLFGKQVLVDAGGRVW